MPRCSESLRTREEGAVDCINDRLSGDCSPAKEPPIQTLDGVFTALDAVKLNVDIALSVWVDGNMDRMTVLFLTLGLDVIFEFFYPRVSSFSVNLLANLSY